MLLNYKECSMEDYVEAINESLKSIDNISTKSLYILYTKYYHDYQSIEKEDNYDFELKFKMRCRRDDLLRELKKRNIKEIV